MTFQSNPDLINPIEPLYFQNKAEFEGWLNENFGDPKSFISPPIHLITGRLGYKIVNRFESGNVEYLKATPRT